MGNKMKRLLSMLLALTMVIGMMPTNFVFATDGETTCEHNYENGVCIVCQEAQPTPEAPSEETPETPSEEPVAQVDETSVVAKVGDTKHESLQDAIDAAQANDVVTLLAGITLTEGVTVPAGKTVTLDLNGMTVSTKITEKLTNSYALITNKGTLTVTDSSENKTGKLSVEYTGETFGYGIGLYTISNEGGTLNIEAGTVENLTTVSGSMYDAIDNNSTLGNTVLNVSGGTINCGYLGIRQFANSTTNENTVNITGGSVTGGNSSIWTQNPGNSQPKANIKISEGTITGRILLGESEAFGVAVSGGTFTVAVPEAYCEKGYIPADNGDGTYGVKECSYVAAIGETKYESLQDAIDAAQANDVVTLLADITLTEGVTVPAGKTVTLDLNGATIVYNSTIQGEAMITNKGTLTINDSVGGGVINYNYTGAADPSYGIGNYTISNAGTLTVNGGKITIADLRQHAKYPIDNNSTTGNAVLVINGGHLYNYNTSAIRQFCNSTTYENSVTITGGVIEGYCAIWVQNPGNKTVNGALSITGGEIKTTASAYVNGTAALKDVSSAIYYTISGEGGAWDDDSLVSITGGIFNENVYLTENAPKTITIGPAATFNGYLEVPNPAEGKAAQIGDAYYDTFEAAYAAAQNGDTITLLADIAMSEILVIDKAITLDGNGKTLTYTGSDRAITVEAGAQTNLTIKNLTVDCTSSYCQRGINYNNSGKLTLENVTVKGTNVTYALNLPSSSDKAEVTITNSALTGNIALNVWGENATITANNTVFTSVDKTAEEGYTAIALNNDGTNIANGTIVTINGGEIIALDENGDESYAIRNSTATGVVNVSAETTVVGTVATPVAIVTYKGYSEFYSCTTLQDAINKAMNDPTATVELLTNITASEIITINGSVVIDGKNHTLTYTGSDRAITAEASANGANLTIKNLTVDCTGSYCQRGINYNTTGELTLENVTVKGTNVTYALNLPGSSDNATVVINNSALSGNIALNIWGENATITANNTVFTSVDKTAEEGYTAIALNNDGTNIANGTTVNITGGKIIAKDEKGELASAVRNSTATGKVNVSESTEVIGLFTRPVALVTYGTDQFYSFTTLQDAINKAMNDSTATVELLTDITASEIITINGSVVIDGKGHTLTSTATRAINIETTDKVELKNLIINAGERAINIINKAATVELNNVTAIANNNAVMIATTAGAVKLTINSSDLTGLAVVNVAGAGSQVAINDTKITNKDASEKEQYGAITVFNTATNAAVTVTGGEIILAGDSRKAYVFAEGATVTGVDDIGYIVAMIGDGGYGTLAAAVKGATAGQTIKMVRDVTMSEILVIDKAITLDGNGYKLTSTAARAINVSGADGVTIKNLTIECSGERAINVIQNATNVTIENVTATAANYTVNVATSAPDAVVAIKNSTLNGLCTVNVSAAGTKVTVDNSTINCNDNNTTAGEGYAALSLNKEAVGGSLVATNTTVNVAEGSDSCKGRNGAEDGTVTINGSTEDVITIVAVITYADSAYYYSFASLAKAIEFAKAGDTITLIRDVTLSESVTVPTGKTVTLDLNGKTISGICGSTQGYLFMVNNGATLTIKDSSTEQTGKITYAGNNSTGWIVDVEGNLVLESGTLELTGTWSIGYAVDVRPNSWGTEEYTKATAFVMNGGNIVSSDGGVRVASSSDAAHKNVSASFVMNGGFIDAAWDGVFIQQSNDAWDVLSVTINGGTIESDLNPIRLYGPAATSYVNGEDCVDVVLNGGTLKYTGTETSDWLVEGIIRTGGGATVDDFLADSEVTASETFAKINVADGYEWVETESGKYQLVKKNVELFKIDGATMTLGNSLAINFFVEPSDLEEGETYYAVITKEYADGREDVVVTVEQADWSWSNNYKQYYVTFNGVAAKEMGDKLTVVIYNSKDEAVSEVWVDSVRDYTMRVLLKEEAKASPNAEKLTLYVDMLNYGAAAQVEFKYNTSDLANNKLTEAQMLYATKDEDVALTDNRVKGEGYSATNLTLRSDITMNFFFLGTHIPTEHDDYYAIATFVDHYGNAEEIRIEGEEFAQLKNDTDWYVPVKGVVVADCRQLVTVTVYDADGKVVATGADSIESYVCRNKDKKDIYMAIMKFGVSAYASFH